MATNSTIGGGPITRQESKPTSKDEILTFVDDAWGHLKQNRYSLEQQIKEAIHFYSGDQWVRYMPHSRKFVKHGLDEWVPTPVTNLIVQHTERILDIFTSGDILPIVDPATQDQRDLDAARAATRVLHSEFGRLGTEENLIIPAATWLAIAGNAFVSATYNARKGDKVRRPKKEIVQSPIQQDVLNCPQCDLTVPAVTQQSRCSSCGGNLVPGKAHQLDHTGAPLMLDREQEIDGEFDEFSIGQIEEHVISPLNFYPEPASSMKRVRYAMEVEPMSVDAVKAMFGSKAKDLVSESIEFDSFGGTYGEALQMDFMTQNEQQKDHVLVKFLRHVPDRRWKKGMLNIVANGKVLYQGNLDDAGDGKLPYVHLKYRHIPGSFWGVSLLNDLIPQQKRLNAIDSHLVSNRKQMVSNQWLVPQGSGVTKVDGRSGLLIPWTPATSGGFKPERLQGVPLPNQVVQERDQVKTDMEVVSGAQEVLSGGVPPGPETGAAIEAIQEQAFRRFGPLVKMWRAGLARHEHRKLLLAKMHWKEERLVRVLGDNSDLESYYVRGADLRQAQDMTVRVGIGLDYSQSAQRSKIMQAAEQGLLGDMRDPMVRGKILERLDIKGFESEYTLDAKKARRYLETMKEGKEVPPPEIVDNHAIQFQIYKDYMLTSDFENLRPPIQDAIRQRAQIHQQVMQQMQQQAMAQAEAAKGAPEGASDQLAQQGIAGAAVPTQQ